MSVQAMEWAIEQQQITDPTARHVLLVLANYADKVGRNAFPAVATLVRGTGLSERTVQSKLEALRHAGLIRLGNHRFAAAAIARADRRPKVYDLDVKLDIARGATAAPRYPQRGAPASGNGMQAGAKRGEVAAPEPKASNNRTGFRHELKRTSPAVANAALAECLSLLHGNAQAIAEGFVATAPQALLRCPGVWESDLAVYGCRDESPHPDHLADRRQVPGDSGP